MLFFILFCSLFNINLSAGGSPSSSPDKADTLYREWSSSRGATKTEIANRLMKTFFDEKDMDTLMVFSKQSQARQNASVMTYMTNHLFYQSRFDEAYQLGVDALLESENIGEGFSDFGVSEHFGDYMSEKRTFRAGALLYETCLCA